MSYKLKGYGRSRKVLQSSGLAVLFYQPKLQRRLAVVFYQPKP